MIERTQFLTFWVLVQRPDIYGFGVKIGRHAIDFGFTRPFGKDTSGARWPFYSGCTILWGGLRWNYSKDYSV